MSPPKRRRRPRSRVPSPDAARARNDRRRRRVITWSALRAAGSTTLLVTIYYLLPLDHSSTAVAITILVIGLIGLIVLVVFQVRSILTSPVPGVRAVESLATSVPLFLLLFASTYVFMAKLSASNFGAQLTHTDALYFTVTVLSGIAQAFLTW